MHVSAIECPLRSQVLDIVPGAVATYGLESVAAEPVHKPHAIATPKVRMSLASSKAHLRCPQVTKEAQNLEK